MAQKELTSRSVQKLEYPTWALRSKHYNLDKLLNSCSITYVVPPSNYVTLYINDGHNHINPLVSLFHVNRINTPEEPIIAT